MTCDCAPKIDELLKQKGERVSVAFEVNFKGAGGRSFYIIKLEKINGGRAKCSTMIANFCPFCGKAQDKP